MHCAANYYQLAFLGMKEKFEIENESDFFPLIGRYAFGDFQQCHDPGGIVIGIAGIGRVACLC